MFIVFFTGKRAGPTARIDLPKTDDTRETIEFLDAVCALVRNARARFGCGSPAIVISSAHSFSETLGIPWRRLARRLERRLSREDVRLRELCCLAPDGWVSYLDPAAPFLGRPLSEISDSPVASTADVPTLETLGAFTPADVHERAVVAEALARAALRDEAASEAEAGAHDLQVAAQLVGARELSLEEFAQLISTARREDGWFALFEQLTFTASAMHSGEPFGETGSAEAAARLRLASERLVRAVELSPTRLTPSLMSICAAAWWFRGLQSVAMRQIGIASSIDPNDERIQVVQGLIDNGTCPLIGGKL